MYAGKRRGVAWTLLHLPLFGAVSWISVALAALIDEEVLGRHVKIQGPWSGLSAPTADVGFATRGPRACV